MALPLAPIARLNALTHLQVPRNLGADAIVNEVVRVTDIHYLVRRGAHDLHAARKILLDDLVDEGLHF